MSLTNRRCAHAALVLALGSACATSEVPNVTYSLGGDTSLGGQATAGAGDPGNGG